VVEGKEGLGEKPTGGGNAGFCRLLSFPLLRGVSPEFSAT